MTTNISRLKNQIINDLTGFQFDSFLIGIISEESEAEKKLIKQNLGRALEKNWGKTVDFNDPDIIIKIDHLSEKITYQIKSLYLFGRYQKIKPGIPQTRWHKKIYQTSVQEEIGNIALKYTKGLNHSFHGCGREDIDVLMLGNGRPFVIEIKNPKIRNIDLKKIEEEINKSSEWVRVKDLKFTSKEKIKEIKSAKPEKTYLAEIQLEKETEIEELKKAEKKLTNITINQKTPKRVIRRRADLNRQRKIFYFKLIKYHPFFPVVQIKTQSGTYIKEFISGDNGRTRPSLSEVLNQKCFVKILKVIKVNY